MLFHFIIPLLSASHVFAFSFFIQSMTYLTLICEVAKCKKKGGLWSVEYAWSCHGAVLLPLIVAMDNKYANRLTAKLWLLFSPHWLSIRFLHQAQTLLLTNLSLHIFLSVATYHLVRWGPFVVSSQFLEGIYLIFTCGNTCLKSYEESVEPSNPKKCNLEHLRLVAVQQIQDQYKMSISGVGISQFLSMSYQ